MNVYTAGLPAPPRIIIPPPTLHPEARHFEGAEPQASLERLVTPPGSSIMPPTLQDWKYESRREAQQILPHLWLGPSSAAKNVQFIQSQKITLLLAIRSTMTARANLLSSQLPGIRYESIDVSANQELITQFQRATDIIDGHYTTLFPYSWNLSLPIDGRELYTFQKDHALANNGELPEGGKTLLYCESGNERSASVAAAYVMQHLGGSAIQAIQLVQSKRFCVCFDDSMKWLLASYEPIWMARRQAFQNIKRNGQLHPGEPGSRGASPSRGSNKRRLEEYQEGGSAADTTQVQPHAPFSDGDGGDLDMS